MNCRKNIKDLNNTRSQSKAKGFLRQIIRNDDVKKKKKIKKKIRFGWVLSSELDGKIRNQKNEEILFFGWEIFRIALQQYIG